MAQWNMGGRPAPQPETKKVPYIGTYKIFSKSASEDELEKAWNEMRALLIKSNLMEPK